ncbi:MAG: hypothetical protein OXI48_12495 [bacterium]|nr:hypothetical protein [bacterium]
MDLIDHQGVGLLQQEPSRILQSCLTDGVVVQRRVGAAPLFGHQPGERGLAALSGTVQHDHPEVVQGLLDAGLHEPRDGAHSATLALIDSLSLH